MSILFCHDHRFVLGQDGAIYSRGQYNDALVTRYERVFGEMFIAGRTMPAPEPFEPTRYNLVFKDASRFLPISNLSGLKSLLFGDTEARRRLEDAMDRVDAVVVRLPSEVGLLASAIARKKCKPLITEVVACIRDGLMSHGGLKARLYAPLAMARMRWTVAKSHWTLYVTERFLQTRYPSHGEQVSISDVQLPPRSDEILMRRLEQIGNAGRPLVFGMVAAMFHNEKRVDVAIEALAQAVQEGADIRLEIAGPGDTETLSRLAERLGVDERVKFLGVLPHGEALFSFLDRVDAYVQTSFQEGLPRALIEAMSRALPALASDAGGTNELLTRDWLHRPGNTVMLAQQMMRLRESALQVRLAEENFCRAANFMADRLDARRLAFWKNFCVAYGMYNSYAEM